MKPVSWFKIGNKTNTTTLTNDPRWQMFNDSSQSCACCGQTFNGIYDIGYDHPDHWPHGMFRDCDQDMLKVGDDFLSSDMCVLGDDRFIKGLVEIPIIGSNKRFAFGAWCSLKSENFDAYFKAYGTVDELNLGCMFGWMCNALPYYVESAEPLETSVTFRGGGMRPSFAVHDERSRIGDDQQSGITFEHLLDIYAASGNDIRPHLMAE